MVKRLCRLPCGKPLAFRTSFKRIRGFASGGVAVKGVARHDGKPEAFRKGGG